MELNYPTKCQKTKESYLTRLQPSEHAVSYRSLNPTLFIFDTLNICCSSQLINGLLTRPPFVGDEAKHLKSHQYSSIILRHASLFVVNDVK